MLALVGTPEQVVDVFGGYYDLGIGHFLIRDFDPLIDAIVSHDEERAARDDRRYTCKGCVESRYAVIIR